MHAGAYNHGVTRGLRRAKLRLFSADATDRVEEAARVVASSLLLIRNHELSLTLALVVGGGNPFLRLPDGSTGNCNAFHCELAH